MLPAQIRPMLAQAAAAPFDSPGYLFEVKWNGLRCLAFRENGRVRLQSRQLVEMSAQFPELAGLRRLPPGTVLDGELTRFPQDENALNQILCRLHGGSAIRMEWSRQNHPVVFLVFDLLYLKDRSLMHFPLMDRRHRLKDLLEALGEECAILSPAIETNGTRLWQWAKAQGLEGIMAKARRSPYLPGKRSAHWLKIKFKE